MRFAIWLKVNKWNMLEEIDDIHHWIYIYWPIKGEHSKCTLGKYLSSDVGKAKLNYRVCKGSITP